MSDFEREEDVRLKYKLTHCLRRSAVSGIPEYGRQPASEMQFRRVVSLLITSLAIVAVLAVNAGLYVAKILMEKSSIDFFRLNYQNIFSVVLSVGIALINQAGAAVAAILAEYENHRTQTDFEDSLIYKIFFIQFISSYGSLAYTAFLAQSVEGGCGSIDCFSELRQLVAIVLLERLIRTIVLDNILPTYMAKRRFLNETKGVDASKMSKAETEYILDPFDVQSEIINRFMNQVILFGFVVLFVPAFPMAPLLGALSIVIEVREFGYTLLFRMQRNNPRGVQDIGSFEGCFKMVAYSAVASNSALIFFSMHHDFAASLPGGNTGVVCFFFGCQALIFLFVRLALASFSDVTAPVSTQLERLEFVRENLRGIERHPDLES